MWREALCLVYANHVKVVEVFCQEIQNALIISAMVHKIIECKDPGQHVGGNKLGISNGNLYKLHMMCHFLPFSKAVDFFRKMLIALGLKHW